MGFLQDKNALIVGLANHHSIAWGVTQAFQREGARLAFTARDAKLLERVQKLTSGLNPVTVHRCDVESNEESDALFEELGKHWEHVDIIVHSVAYAPPGQLSGDYLDCVSREGFRTAHDVSSYSFAALAKAGRKMLRPGSALLAMSYLGAARAAPNYNVMGLAKASLEANVRYMAAALGPDQIRVNALSPGPIKTLSAKGVSDFTRLLDYGARSAPLRRNVTIDEVGNSAAFLCSDLASGGG